MFYMCASCTGLAVHVSLFLTCDGLFLQVWWDFAMVKPDLQGNQGNIYGMNASSASLVKAFIELDPYKVGGSRLIPSTRPSQT